MDQRDVVVAAEEAHDLLRLALPQQAGIDKDAGQPVADRLVQQRRGDRGIDPAGQTADDPAAADLAADPRRSPGRGTPPSSSRRGSRRPCA